MSVWGVPTSDVNWLLRLISGTLTRASLFMQNQLPISFPRKRHKRGACRQQKEAKAGHLWLFTCVSEPDNSFPWTCPVTEGLSSTLYGFISLLEQH